MSLNDYENLKNICEKRHSCRCFSDQPVSPELILKIKQIALTSPYVSGKKNWEIVEITDKRVISLIARAVRKKSTQLQAQMNDDFQVSFGNYANMFTVFENAPVLLLPTFRISAGFSLMITSQNKEITQFERDNYVKSISCVAMLIHLAATSQGLGSCYMTGPLIAEKEIASIAKIKNGRSIGAVIPIGFPNHKNDR
ncbi:MAG: nitroreductase family protein [bacterium]|nr:nitroreductase family protein [bacterium]